MADLRPLLERLKALPELEGASIVPASPDLLVLVPRPGQRFAQVKQALLQQPEVYELEISEVQYRREGKKPYDQLRKEKLVEVLTSTKGKIQERIREKLRELVRGREKRKDGSGVAIKKAGKAADPAIGAGNDAQEDRNREKAAQRAAKRAIKRAARRAKRKAAKNEEQAAAEL